MDRLGQEMVRFLGSHKLKTFVLEILGVYMQGQFVHAKRRIVLPKCQTLIDRSYP